MKNDRDNSDPGLDGEQAENRRDDRVAGKRRSLLGLVALALTAGCSGGGSSSVRDTDPGYYGYYGHGHFHRSPYRRYPRRRY